MHPLYWNWRLSCWVTDCFMPLVTTFNTLRPYYSQLGQIKSGCYWCLITWKVNWVVLHWVLANMWKFVMAYGLHWAMHPNKPNVTYLQMGWVGLWGFLWWAPSAKGKDHHGVSSGWSSVWHRSNTGLSSTQYEQIPIILGIWPFWLTPFFFRSITFWRVYG